MYINRGFWYPFFLAVSHTLAFTSSVFISVSCRCYYLLRIWVGRSNQRTPLFAIINGYDEKYFYINIVNWRTKKSKCLRMGNDKAGAHKYAHRAHTHTQTMWKCNGNFIESIWNLVAMNRDRPRRFLLSLIHKQKKIFQHLLWCAHLARKFHRCNSTDPETIYDLCEQKKLKRNHNKFFLCTSIISLFPNQCA